MQRYDSCRLYHSYTVNFQTTLERVKLWDSFLKSGSATPLQAQPSLPDMNGSGGKHSGTHQLSSSQKKRIRELLKTARKDPAHSQLGLQSYLLSPIQRIPRYKLLLEALAECTPSLDDPSQPDADLVIALRLISDLTLEMNEKTRDSEGRKRLLYWQARIKSRGQSPLVAPHRSLLKEGTMVLSRVVRRKSAIVTTKNAMSEEQTSLVQIHTLDVDTTPQTLVRTKRRILLVRAMMLTLAHSVRSSISSAAIVSFFSPGQRVTTTRSTSSPWSDWADRSAVLTNLLHSLALSLVSCSSADTCAQTPS